MKERIVLDFGAKLKNICNGCAEGVKAKCKQTQEDHLQCALQKSELEEFKVEKYPTTWEELKELCKDLESKDVFITSAGDCIEYYGLQFWVSGAIWHEKEKFSSIKSYITPQQMWNIIKSLIGEE